MTSIGFLGGGQMASALINGLCGESNITPKTIFVSDPYQPCLESHTAKGYNATSDNHHVVVNCPTIFLCTKPNMVSSVLSDLGSKLEGKLLISICAGVTLATMESLVPSSCRVIRVMPNTPCLVGQCASAFAIGRNATGADGELVSSLLKCVGVAHIVEEKLLDAVTGLSGSGPAYVFIMIEALADGGVRAGLPRKVALELAGEP
tara:strand:+ start:141 stop:755 length:615 start_codon:yes stop_codon:yes gene_type:complete